MEMMIVLLIVAVIAAASAPLVTKKMSSTGGDLDSSPWVYTGVAKSIAYNMDGSASSAIIGASKVPNGSTPKLYIESSGDEAQIGFGRAGSNDVMSLVMDTVNNRVGFSNATIPSNSVAMGTKQNIVGPDSIIIGSDLNNYSDHSICIGNASTTGAADHILGRFNIAIGDSATAARNFGIAIGYGAIADGKNGADNGTLAYISAMALGTMAGAHGENSIAIGSQAEATLFDSIAIGGTSSAADTKTTLASGKRSIAIGPGAQATMENSAAIGYNATAEHLNSTAIGYLAKTKSANQIVLGNGGATVYIPGNLVVGGNTLLGLNTGAFTVFRNGSTGAYQPTGYQYENGGRLLEIHAAPNKTVGGFTLSDRRLKNVGDKFTAGVNELSKLDFFHYTFKKDKTKTPHVGVIAQDLQKVFPDAVTKGDDGFLRIRWEDMFYAAINAIKELNTKITEIADNLMNTNSKVEEQAKIIEEQQNTIENQQKTIDSLIKRIESIEKKI